MSTERERYALPEGLAQAASSGLPDQPGTPHHGATVLSARRYCWSTCICGWTSPDYPTTAGASLAFAEHVKSSQERTP